MLKKYLSILLIFAVSLHTGREALLSTWYFLNKVQITEKFCVNKENESLNCEGKCHLTKLMEGFGDNETNTPMLPPLEERIPFIGISMTLCELPDVIDNRSNILNDLYRSFYFFTPSFSVFHPPEGIG